MRVRLVRCNHVEFCTIPLVHRRSPAHYRPALRSPRCLARNTESKDKRTRQSCVDDSFRWDFSGGLWYFPSSRANHVRPDNRFAVSCSGLHRIARARLGLRPTERLLTRRVPMTITQIESATHGGMDESPYRAPETLELRRPMRQRRPAWIRWAIFKRRSTTVIWIWAGALGAVLYAFEGFALTSPVMVAWAVVTLAAMFWTMLAIRWIDKHDSWNAAYDPPSTANKPPPLA